MTSVLSDLQADYERRAQQAVRALGPDGRMVAFTSLNGDIVWHFEPLTTPTEPRKPKATRTYTGAALSRRQEWGRFWGGILQAAAHDLRNEASPSE